jgi:hypothetical protein
MTRFVLMIAVAATSAAPGLRYAAHPGDGAGLACRGVKAPRSAYLGRVSGGRVQLPIALRATGLPDRAPSGDAWTPEAAVRCSVIVEERDGETWSTVTGGIATGPMEPSGDGWRTPEGAAGGVGRLPGPGADRAGRAAAVAGPAGRRAPALAPAAGRGVAADGAGRGDPAHFGRRGAGVHHRAVGSDRGHLLRCRRRGG